jgi:hypothetical protein
MKGIINKKTKYILFIILSIFIFIIFYNSLIKTTEGFNIKDIDNIFDDIKDVARTVGDIPNEIKNIDNKLTQQVTNVGNKLEKKTEEMGNQILKKTEQMGKEIEKKTVTILTDKLKSIFIQLGDIFNKGIINPLLSLFVSIANIFVQIFNILKEIGNKIVSLPNCIFTYAIKETIDTFEFIYNRIMPKFIKNIVSFVYRYTLSYIFGFIGNITGYDDSIKKCYGFNVSTNVDKINSNLTDIYSSFKKDFGRLNFSEIKV